MRKTTIILLLIAAICAYNFYGIYSANEKYLERQKFEDKVDSVQIKTSKNQLDKISKFEVYDLKSKYYSGTITKTIKNDSSDKSTEVTLIVNGLEKLNKNSDEKTIIAHQKKYPDLLKYFNYNDQKAHFEIKLRDNRYEDLSLESLKEALKSDRKSRVEWALESLKLTNHKIDETILPEVFTLINRPYPETPYGGTDLLIKIGKSGFDYYREILPNASENQSIAIGSALSNIGQQAYPLIQEFLQKYPNNNKFQEGVVTGLIFNKKFKRHLLEKMLYSFADSPDKIVRQNTMGALSFQGILTDKSKDILIKGLDDKETDVKISSLFSLERLVTKLTKSEKEEIISILKEKYNRDRNLTSNGKPLEPHFKRTLKSFGYSI